MKNRQLRASLLLTLTSMVWGAAFFFQKTGLDTMGPFTFHGVRCFFAGCTLIPFLLIHRKKAALEGRPFAAAEGSGTRPGLRTVLTAGAALGFFLGCATITQQIGIMLEPSAGKAGFISALYMIIVPILGLFLKKKVPLTVWFAAAIAAFGLYLLCIDGDFSLSYADFWLFGCALAFSVHILFVDYFASFVYGPLLACMQFFVSSLMGFILIIVTNEPVSFKGIVDGLFPLIYAGVFSAGVGYTLQIIAQKDLLPAVTSLLMSFEAVFAALFGWLMSIITGELIEENALSLRQIAGCAIMFAAILLSQAEGLIEMRKAKKKAERT